MQNYITIFLLLFTQHLFAFKSYDANYNVYWHGIKAGVSSHKLKKISNNHYSVNIVTEPLLSIIPFEFSDISEFKVQKNSIKPLFHEFKYKENTKNKYGRLDFDWNNLKVINTMAKNTFEKKLTDGVQDKVSHLFQLKKDLIIGKKKFKYIVAKKDELKDYEFEVVGTETLNTKIGVLNTVKVEHVSKDRKRKTVFWLAQELEYLMVKLQQMRNESVVGIIRIQDFKTH